MEGISKEEGPCIAHEQLIIVDESPAVEGCRYCAHEQPEKFKFCANCGRRNASIVEKEKHTENIYSINLRNLAIYSLLTIVLLIISSLPEEDTFELFLAWSVVFVVIDLVFSLFQPRVWRLIRFRELRLMPLLAVMGIGLCSGIIVSYSMDHLNLLIFDETSSGYMYQFYHLEHPLWMAILLIAVCPAIFEELAFRGFVFNNLQVIGGEKSAIYGSTFIFALVHFSLLSFIWIIPFGLMLAHFRRKYSTLIYGMAAHFVHNATVVLIEYYEIFA